MKPFTECRIFNYLSLASSPKQTVSDEEFSSSYTEYEQYLYDLAIESVSVSERLRHLLHSKVELISLKKLFTRTGHFHTAVAEFYLDKCLLLVEAEIELVNFGVQPYYKNAGNYIKTFINFLDYAYENARLSNGLFYEDWTGATPKRAEQLLMQDAALESLGMIALYKGETVTEE